MAMKTIDLVFEESSLSIAEVAEKARLLPERVEAIVLGRWLPSPAEREQMASALGIPTDQVAWGHSVAPRNIRYHRFGLPEEF